MNLYMPTKVFSEHHCVSNHRDEFKMLGKKAMIVTGKHSSRNNGSLDDVKEALAKNGQEYVIFDDVEENPSVETVVKAAKAAVEEGVDFFFAIGGGSPMDASKAISLLSRNPEKLDHALEFLYTFQRADYYPVVAVPTTCGTGSEVTPYSVLTIHSRRTKKSIAHRIFPEIALMDARYLKTAGRNTIVNTCVDALGHLIEAFLCTNSNEINKIYAREGLRMWGEFKESLFQNSFSDELLEKYLHTSMLAGIAIAHTSTSIPHGLSYQLTYEKNIAHGRAVGYFLPGFLRIYEDGKRVEEVLNCLGFSAKEEFQEYIEKLIGKPEVTRAEWMRNVDTMMNQPEKLKNHPFPMTRDTLCKMLTV